jgi:hypothetical protein
VPALFSRNVIGPGWRSASLMARRTAAGSRTSAASGSACPLGDHRGRLADLALSARHERHRCARAGQCQGDRVPDAPNRAGDEHHLLLVPGTCARGVGGAHGAGRAQAGLAGAQAVTEAASCSRGNCRWTAFRR